MYSVFIPDPAHSLDRKFNLTNCKIEVVAAQAHIKVITMEAPLETQMNEIMSQPGVTGVLCADNQGLALAAKGTMKPDSAGLVAGMASKASKLKHGMGADDQPVVVIEFDTGNILVRSHENSTLAVHKV